MPALRRCHPQHIAYSRAWTDLLEQYCQIWALEVNPKNTKIMIFHRLCKSQATRPMFSIGTKYTEYCTHYNYLGLKISSAGDLNEAVNGLREKAHRAYSIKKLIQVEIPIQIWLKQIECVIEPITLYGSELWGPLLQQDFTQWDKPPIETPHVL